jgi:hypothetical protein
MAIKKIIYSPAEEHSRFGNDYSISPSANPTADSSLDARRIRLPPAGKLEWQREAKPQNPTAKEAAYLTSPANVRRKDPRISVD